MIDVKYDDIPFYVFGPNNWVLGVWKIGPITEENARVLDINYDQRILISGVSKIHVLQHTVFSASIPEDWTVGEIIVKYEGDATEYKTDLVVGRNTAEWAYERSDVIGTISYAKPIAGFSFRTQVDSDVLYNGNYYYVGVDVDPAKKIASIALHLTQAIQDDDNYNIGIQVKGITLELEEGIQDKLGAILSEIDVRPVAKSPYISGTVEVSQTLSGEYAFVDYNDNTTEGTSTYRWLYSDTVDGTYAVIPGAVNNTYLVEGAYIDKYIKFEVTPVTAEATPIAGDPVLSSAVGPVVAV